MGIVSSASRSLGVSSALFSPSNISGLSLWLKADAGVTTVATQFISQIILSGAGSTFANGTYTRATGGTTPFYNTGNNSVIVYQAGVQWNVVTLNNGENQDSSLYVVTIFELNGVEIIDDVDYLEGDAPTPGFSAVTTPTGNTGVLAWADQSSNANNFLGGSNGGSLPTIITNTLNGKPVINFNGIDTALTSPAGLLGGFSALSFIAVWKVEGEQSNVGIFGTSNYSNLEVIVNGDVQVRIRNNNYNATFIDSGLTNVDEFALSYFDASNLTGSAFKNGAEVTAPTANQGAVEMPLASNITYELGRYAYPEYQTLYASFQLAELIIYNSKLTTHQRQQVETYLNSKYAIY